MVTALSLPATPVTHSRYNTVVMCHNCYACRAALCIAVLSRWLQNELWHINLDPNYIFCYLEIVATNNVKH